MNDSQMDPSIDLDESFTDMTGGKKNWQKKDRCFLCDCRFNLKVKRHHWWADQPQVRGVGVREVLEEPRGEEPRVRPVQPAAPGEKGALTRKK